MQVTRRPRELPPTPLCGLSGLGSPCEVGGARLAQSA